MVFFLCLVFGLFAVVALVSGMGLLRTNGAAYDDAIPAEKRAEVRRLQRQSATIALALGLLFAVASAIAWRSWPLALAVGTVPFLILVALFATGRLEIISRLSTGEGG